MAMLSISFEMLSTPFNSETHSRRTNYNQNYVD